ncbi:MAG TPA: EamA family transporter [Chitinophagaceae bacterium]|nr:EamA family transporter [Chitinophagaceae bacterium]
MKKDLNKAYIALGLVSFFWGTTYIASRIGTQHMPGLFISGIRQFSSGIILVGFFLLKGHKLPDWKSLKKISIQSILLLCIANGALTWSLEYISGGLAAIIAALVPLFIVLFSAWLSAHTKFTNWMIVGLAAGFLGVLTIFYDYPGQTENKSFGFGILLASLSVISWSLGTVYSSKQKLSIGILFNVGLQMLIAGIVLLIICLITGKYVNPVNAGENAWLSLLYLIVFGSLLAYSAFVFAVSKLPPTHVSIYAYINPVVAVSLGCLLLHEKMNANMAIGSFITLGGVYIVNRENKKVKYKTFEKNTENQKPLTYASENN